MGCARALCAHTSVGVCLHPQYFLNDAAVCLLGAVLVVYLSTQPCRGPQVQAGEEPKVNMGRARRTPLGDQWLGSYFPVEMHLEMLEPWCQIPAKFTTA